jgi:hypothetical protein
MEILPVFGAWFVGMVSSVLRYDQTPMLFSPELNISAELGERLSPNAAIFRATDPGWSKAILRWNAFSPPTYTALVEVATEEDIQETVILLSSNTPALVLL